MDKAKMVVLARAAPGLGLELEEWLANQHLPDMLRVPGVDRARLFQLETLAGEATDFRTIAIYDLNANDVRSVVREAGGRMGTPAMPRSVALGSPNLAFLARQLVDIGSGTSR